MTPVGDNGQNCVVHYWSQGKTPSAHIACFVEADGAAPFDTQFVVNWVVG
ncbi:MAG: hypothetical protein ACLQFR_00395 [Streptosporangiaceae bacterium]